MDVQTVEFKPFTDQKPGTYVTIYPAKPPRHGNLHFTTSEEPVLTFMCLMQLWASQKGYRVPAAALQRILRHKHLAVYPRGR